MSSKLFFLNYIANQIVELYDRLALKGTKHLFSSIVYPKSI